MAGLWEGVPASPCSAASDDTNSASRGSHPAFAKLSMPPKRHLTADLSASADQPRKRSRRPDSTDSNSASASGSIEFVEATSTANSDFVARLNTTAQDERRKALLLRLQAIDRKKKNLAQRSPQSVDDDVVLVEERSASPPTVTSPSDVKSGSLELSKQQPSKQSQPLRKTPLKKTTRGRPPAPLRQPDVIVVDDDSSASSPVARVPPKPSRAKKGSNASKPSSVAPTRASNRVRRPRTLASNPSDSANDPRAPTPTCMTKCKRFQFCKKLSNSLLKDSSAAPFSAPVNELWPPEAIPRYFDVITSPMDLRTVKKGLETSVYISPCKNGALPYEFDVEKFADDVRLVFRNAMVYNKAGDMLYNCAQSLMADFDRTLSEQLPEPLALSDIPPTLSRKRGPAERQRKDRRRAPLQPRDDTEYSGSPLVSDTPLLCAAPATVREPRRKNNRAQASKNIESETSELIPDSIEEISERLTYLRNSRPCVLARTPLPKGSGYLSRAALLYNVEISHAQKRRCADVILKGKVPPSKMEVMIDMMRPADSTSNDDDDDFELEFDKLDNKSWRNLEAFLEQFVPGFKTIRHSTLGREFTSVEQVDEEMGELQAKMKKLDEKRNSDAENSITCPPKKSRSFFDGDVVDDSSSESDSDSDGSDSSDSDSDDE